MGGHLFCVKGLMKQSQAIKIEITAKNDTKSGISRTLCSPLQMILNSAEPSNCLKLLRETTWIICKTILRSNIVYFLKCLKLLRATTWIISKTILRSNIVYKLKGKLSKLSIN